MTAVALGGFSPTRSFRERLRILLAVVVPNVGEEWCVDKFTETVQTKPEYAGWGTGAGTAAKGDTDLFTPAAEARVLCTTSKTGSGSTAKYQAVGTIVSASGQTITNGGLFTASSSGTLIVKGDHTGVALLTGDSITYTYTIDPS
jgi:hypothetical protein